MKSYRVCGLDPCTPFRPGPRSKNPAKLPVWVSKAVILDVRMSGPYVGFTKGCPYIGSPPTGRPFTLLVCERPHTHGKASAAACIAMGVWAGWLAAQVNAERTLCMPPQVWKQILIPGFANAPKAQYCANIVQMLSLEGLDPKDPIDQDTIDAHGLCAVAAKLAAGGLIDKYKKWELKL